MRKNTIIFAAGMVIALGAGAFFALDKDTSTKKSLPVASTISMTDQGFEPREIAIKVGDLVRFTNTSNSAYVWPASDLHPTHELYSEFDPREPVGPGKSWDFVFEKAGTWQFHDHLKSRNRGVITVNP